VASDEGDSGDGLRREREGHGEGGEGGSGHHSCMLKECAAEARAAAEAS